MKANQKLQNIGALWLNTRRDGSELFKGSVTVNGETVEIVMLYNQQKTSPDDNRPHFVLLQPIIESAGAMVIEGEPHPF